MIKASKTRKPPTIMLMVSFSERKITEESTVTTGSSVEASAAVDAPVFSMPVRNDQNARTVEIIASRNTAVITASAVRSMFLEALLEIVKQPGAIKSGFSKEWAVREIVGTTGHMLAQVMPYNTPQEYAEMITM